MFKKKPNIKNLSPLRSSDRRRITDQIIADYQVDVPKPGDANAQEEGGAPSAGIGTIRSSLLPEGALSAKFTTTAGADLKVVNGTVYAGAHPGDELRILWIKLEEKIIPTVYSLWRHPGLLPLLHTPDAVIQKMRGGAELMTPGLARGPPFPAKATKGAVVAIASYENPSVPYVVGECEIDVSALTEVRGAKGHAVKGIHWDGDELWGWSQIGKAGTPAPYHIEGWYPEIDEDLPQDLGALDVHDEADGEDAGGVPVEANTSARNDFVEGEDMKAYEDVGRQEKTMKEIDDAFRSAFLYALYNAGASNREKPNHGIEFPIPQSLFFSTLVLPHLPIFEPEDQTTYQIKKTSWKNVKKFVKALEKEKLIKSKDRNGGETIVLDANFEDPSVISFVPYRLPKKTTAASESNAFVENGRDDSIGQKLKVLQLYKPKESLGPLFEVSKASIRSFYLPTELRPIINEYLKIEELLPTGPKGRTIQLNPFLANTIFASNSTIDREVLARGHTSHESLISHLLDSTCIKHYAILRNDESRDDQKPKAGLPPKVKIILETRSGNKTATRVSGIETFYIHPTLLAEELKKTCSSSTSVGPVRGVSPKHPEMEIMVQGPQKDAILKALEKRGVRKEWVEFQDKSKGTKKR